MNTICTPVFNLVLAYLLIDPPITVDMKFNHVRSSLVTILCLRACSTSIKRRIDNSHHVWKILFTWLGTIFTHSQRPMVYRLDLYTMVTHELFTLTTDLISRGLNITRQQLLAHCDRCTHWVRCTNPSVKALVNTRVQYLICTRDHTIDQHTTCWVCHRRFRRPDDWATGPQLLQSRIK
jgi:hypothetical protein